MDRHDREVMIKQLMKVRLRRKLLEKMRDSEIQNLFSTLKGYFR